MGNNRFIPAHSRAPVDEFLPFGQLFVLGLQHVLVMYAGAVVVPLIIGSAIGLPNEQIAFLVSADLFVSGLATLVQSAGFLRWFGIRLPIIMGVSFTGVGPMIAIASNPDLGLVGIYGAMIVAGLFGVLCAPLVARLLRFFPPVVLGTELMMVGLAIMGVSATWAAGGLNNPNYGSLLYIGEAALVAAGILIITKYFRGFIQHIAVLLALLIGILVAYANGQIDFSGVQDAAWFGFIMPFHFGMPKFELWPILAMTMVMMATFIESTGMFFAVGDMVEKKIDQKSLIKGFRADGLGYLLGATFNIFPYTSFAENVGLVSMTGVRSRWVTAIGGVILMVLGLIPKLSAIVAAVPHAVLGGATLIMFGMIAVTGIKMLSDVDFTHNHYNAYVVATSLGIGMLPVIAPDFFSQFPEQMAPFLQSGILLCAVSAVLLNVFFNGVPKKVELPEIHAEELAS